MTMETLKPKKLAPFFPVYVFRTASGRPFVAHDHMKTYRPGAHPYDLMPGGPDFLSRGRARRAFAIHADGDALLSEDARLDRH